MGELNKLTISEARDRLRSKEISSVELTNSCLAEIDAADPLGAFVHKTPELALAQAENADERLSQGSAPDMCGICLLYTSPSPRDATLSRMPSSA